MAQQDSILIVGDFFPVPSNYCRFRDGDISYLLGDGLCELFNNSSYRICNLEGALTDRPGFCEKTGPTLYAPTEVVNTYKKLSINCCTLANNHITDAGSEGVIDTINTLNAAGIHHIGAGFLGQIDTHYFFRLGSRTICLYNVAEEMYNAPGKGRAGANLYDEFEVCKDLEQIKKVSDYVIVVYHGGIERFRYPSPQVRKRFYRLSESGADMVLSQHTHCVGSEEYHNGSYLLYGQGNFLFRSFNNEFTDTGLVLRIVFQGSQTQIERYLVNAIGDTVRLDSNQDLSGFYKRSSLLSDELYLQYQFDQYCYNELPQYLSSYKGRSPFRKLLSRVFPDWYKKMLYNGYERKQLLRVLHSLRSDQNREIAINGIKVLLEKEAK